MTRSDNIRLPSKSGSHLKKTEPRAGRRLLRGLRAYRLALKPTSVLIGRDAVAGVAPFLGSRDRKEIIYESGFL